MKKVNGGIVVILTDYEANTLRKSVRICLKLLHDSMSADQKRRAKDIISGHPIEAKEIISMAIADIDKTLALEVMSDFLNLLTPDD